MEREFCSALTLVLQTTYTTSLNASSIYDEDQLPRFNEMVDIVFSNNGKSLLINWQGFVFAWFQLHHHHVSCRELPFGQPCSSMSSEAGQLFMLDTTSRSYIR